MIDAFFQRLSEWMSSLRAGGKWAIALWVCEWLAGLWLVDFLSVVTLLAVPIVLGIRKQFLAAFFFVALSPAAFYSGAAARDYLHKDVNISQGHDGCIHYAVGCIHYAFYKWTVFGLIHTFGPVPGVYLGPVPTQEEALAALRQGSEISRDSLDQGRVELPGTTIDLTWRSRHLIWSSGYPMENSHAKLPAVRAALWRGRCVIVEIPDEPSEKPPRVAPGTKPTTNPERTSGAIVLIDRQTGWPFASRNYDSRAKPRAESLERADDCTPAPD